MNSFREIDFHGYPTAPSIIANGLPYLGLPKEVFIWRLKNLPNLYRGLAKILAAKALGIPFMYGRLDLVKRTREGVLVPYGLASFRVVTTAGAAAIVDGFQNTVEIETFNYHGIGTGTNGEAVGDTALQTELTTQYNPDSTRATGAQTEPASTQYRTTATNTVDAAVAITEHGIFTQAATGGGTLLDRTVFSAINLASGDSLQSQYTLTITAGS